MFKVLKFALILLFSMCSYRMAAQNFQIIDSLEKVILSPVADTIKVIALGELSWEYHVYDKQKAISYARQELELARKTNFLKGIGLGHMDLGVTYSYHREYSRAIEHYQQALPFFEKAQKPFLVALMHYNTAVAYSKFEASDKAVNSFFKAIDLLAESGDWGNVSQGYTGIANNYATLRQFSHAIKYHLKAIEVAREHQDFEMLAVALSDYSATFSIMHGTENRKEHLDSAFTYLSRVRRLLHEGKVQNPVMLPTITFNLGHNYFQREKFQEALPLFLEAIKLSGEVNMQAGVCQGHTMLGRIYLLENNYNKAYEHFHKALQPALETNPQFAADAYAGLRDLAVAQNNFQEAYSYQDKWVNLKDSIYNIEKAEIAERLGMLYDTEKKEVQIASLLQENNFQRRQKIMYFAIAMLGLLISGIVFYLLRLKQKVLVQKENLIIETSEKTQLREALAGEQQKKLQQELQMQAALTAMQEESFRKEMDYKERELTGNVMLLEQQNSFLQQVKSRLQSILPLATETDAELKKICRWIDNQLFNEQDTEKFLAHFEKVHPEFFTRLESVAAAKLSLTDLKLSAYIRMNISTKEMANLLNVEPKSIQMARYRLKRKLHIPADADLMEFIRHL